MNCLTTPIASRFVFAFALALGASTLRAQTSDVSQPTIYDGKGKSLFGYLGWEKLAKSWKVADDGLQVVAPNGKGGMGLFIGRKVSFSGHDDCSPTITVVVKQANKAAGLNLAIGDADGTSYQYSFDLSKAVVDQPSTLVAQFGAAINEPGKVLKPGQTPGLDTGNIVSVMVIGDWGAVPVNLAISNIAVTAPTDAILADRAKLKEHKEREALAAAKKAEARAKAIQDALDKGLKHTADGVEVTHVSAVAKDVIAITLQAGTNVSNRVEPYVPQEGDELVEGGKPSTEFKDGQPVEVRAKDVFRTVNGKRTQVASLTRDGQYVIITGKTNGQQLDETVVDEPEAYLITSAEDSAYAQPLSPTKVYRKGKPNGWSRPLPFLYTISLVLPSPLKEDASYTITFKGVNTSKESVVYTHKPAVVQSPAIQAIQTGYRPDDPYKRAFVSFWMGVDNKGKGDSCTPDVDEFMLIDASGKTVFTGKTELAKAEGDKEQISVHEMVDYSKSAVRRLDFSIFNTPGEYRILVPGIGVSGPVRIANDVWEQPFKAAMHGILTQRQGMALGPPFSDYIRPATFMEKDGVEFYQMTIPIQKGQEPARGPNMLALAKEGKLERVHGVHGGYQDAGDWDTLGYHISATIDLLGLYDLNPEAFKSAKLSLPPEEASNELPDILDEAMWQMPLFKSLQMPDGGVRGGYGYGWGCPARTTSAMIRSAGVYAVDGLTTMNYAAAASRLARVLAPYNQKLAQEYLETAKRAWAWGVANPTEVDSNNAKAARAIAAVELLMATRDASYDEVFKQVTDLNAKGTYMIQHEASFAYARLPDGLGDPELKKKAIERLSEAADASIAVSRKNAYDVINAVRPDKPLIGPCHYFSTPAGGGMGLIYAYELTKKPEYLAAAVQGSNFSLGANPDNLSFCTGVGYNYQKFNFIVDAIVTGQLPGKIIGHIPYGHGNEGNAMSQKMNAWVRQWVLYPAAGPKMSPNWEAWPVYEQYLDTGIYPLNAENTFNDTTTMAACYWFYLNSRK